MGMFDSFNTSATGLTAQRLRMDLISNNVANATTTRTPEGGAYRRKRAIFAPVNIRPNYKSPLVPNRIESGIGKGVRVVKIEDDQSPVPARVRSDAPGCDQDRPQDRVCRDAEHKYRHGDDGPDIGLAFLRGKRADDQ